MNDDFDEKWALAESQYPAWAAAIAADRYHRSLHDRAAVGGAGAGRGGKAGNAKAGGRDEKARVDAASIRLLT